MRILIHRLIQFRGIHHQFSSLHITTLFRGTSMAFIDTSSSSNSDSICRLTEEKDINKYLYVSDQEAQEEAIKVDPSYDLKDESRRLLQEMHIAIEIVKESDFYTNLIQQVEGDAFQEQLKSFLGTIPSLNMVIYALGSLEFSYNSQYQLAIALLLKDRCYWIEDIEVYDPASFRADIIVLKELGCHVLPINEKAKRIVKRPTLFFIPYYPILMGNLLEVNWSPSQLKQLLVLANAYKYRTPDKDSDEYLETIQKYTTEIPAENFGARCDNIFYSFAWKYFKVDSQLDMDKSLSDTYETWEKSFQMSKSDRLEHRRLRDEIDFDDNGYGFTARHSLAKELVLDPYRGNTSEKDWSEIFMNCRGPREYRCCWRAPPKGWIKLNIASRVREGKISSGYGGICHNEHGEPLLVYSGALENVDEFAACVHALKVGLADILQKFTPTSIIVEGDNLKVIQWVTRYFLPVRHADRSLLDELDNLLGGFHCYVIYHIYEEANGEAICLAEHENREMHTDRV